MIRRLTGSDIDGMNASKYWIPNQSREVYPFTARHTKRNSGNIGIANGTEAAEDITCWKTISGYLDSL
jgi:hypothetical protein